MTTQLTDSQQKTQSSFLALQLITASCHAVLNTVLTVPPTKPTWFDDLNSKLDRAKTNAQDWIDNIAPQLTASIPNQVIDYATIFDASIDTIDDLYKQYPTASGKNNPQVQEAIQILNVLKDQVNNRISTVDAMGVTLKNWGDKMQKSHDELLQGASSIQSAIVDLQTDVEHMDTAMESNRQAITKLNDQLVYCQVAVGVGIFVLVAGVALCIATAGTAAVVGGGVAVLGAAAIVGGAVGWGVLQNQVNDDYRDIATEQKQKNADQQQIIALKGISMATNQAVSAIETATSTLSDFRTSWSLYHDELTGVVDKLVQGASMSALVMEKVFADAARNEWVVAVQYAQDLVNAKLSVETKALPLAA